MPRNHGSAALVYQASYGGGLLGGDSIRLTADIGARATAFLSTQASTKVYRSHRRASVELNAAVADGGTLVVAPDPVVCFARSTYNQAQRFNLERGAALVLVDWFTSGRRASGERWEFDAYTSRTTVFSGGRLVLHDAVSLRASDGAIAERMQRFEVLATAVLIGPPVLEAAEHILARIAGSAVEHRGREVIGASRLGGGGCVLRIAGQSTDAVSRRLRDYLSFVPALLGDDPWIRKW